MATTHRLLRQYPWRGSHLGDKDSGGARVKVSKVAVVRAVRPANPLSHDILFFKIRFCLITTKQGHGL